MARELFTDGVQPKWIRNKGLMEVRFLHAGFHARRRRRSASEEFQNIYSLKFLK